jgi:hypothetical protein
VQQEYAKDIEPRQRHKAKDAPDIKLAKPPIGKQSGGNQEPAQDEKDRYAFLPSLGECVSVMTQEGKLEMVDQNEENS